VYRIKGKQQWAKKLCTSEYQKGIDPDELFTPQHRKEAKTEK
jgi:hypothetical protein